MNKSIALSAQFAIGFMLFALFFGAGNLIFPAELGQYAGENFWQGIIGFLTTGVGLTLLGVIAVAYSGSKNLQDLANRVSPAYSVFFTTLLYLTIGPFFAAPRTATVAYEVGFMSYIPESSQQLGLFIFTFIFFSVTLVFSLYPAKIVANIGKILAPTLVILLGVLLVAALMQPMGSIGNAEDGYVESPYVTGFLEGYKTMDALGSLVMAMIVINAITSLGVSNKRQILLITIKTGLIAATLLAGIYIGLAYLGGISVESLGLVETGGPVLSHAATYYFGTMGSVLLAIMIVLACLTTAIGLVVANAEYFNTLFPNISYKVFVIFFSTMTFVIANFGLANIIKFSMPVLMFLYPLAIVLMLLTFLSKLFNHARIVYVTATVVTFLISIVDGIKELSKTLKVDFNFINPIVDVYDKILPFYAEGLGWLVPAVTAIVVTGIFAKVFNLSTPIVER